MKNPFWKIVFSRIYLHISLWIAVCAGFAFALPVQAQTVSLVSSKGTFAVGERVTVTVLIDSEGRSLNTVGGTVSVPTDFSISEVRYGNSIVSLWIQQPTINKTDNAISFAGGIPGGFNSSSGTLLTFYITSEKADRATLRLRDVKVLLNDGAGTEAVTRTHPLLLTVLDFGDGTADAHSLLSGDETSPEEFTPLISKDKNIGTGDYFISFFAVDKDTGVARYRIREDIGFSFLTIREGKWHKAQTPYTLAQQWLPTVVYVAAEDGAGNITIATVFKSPHLFFSITALLLMLALVFYVYRMAHRKLS